MSNIEIVDQITPFCALLLEMLCGICYEEVKVLFFLYFKKLCMGICFFLIIGGGATSNLMLIQGAICWVSVCSRPSLTYAVNVRIFKVHVLILSMRTQTRPRFNVPSERRRK